MKPGHPGRVLKSPSEELVLKRLAQGSHCMTEIRKFMFTASSPNLL